MATNKERIDSLEATQSDMMQDIKQLKKDLAQLSKKKAKLEIPVKSQWIEKASQKITMMVIKKGRFTKKDSDELMETIDTIIREELEKWG